MSRSQRVSHTSRHMIAQSDTFHDGRNVQGKPNFTPRWQTRWEQAMRPSPRRPQTGRQPSNHVIVPEMKVTCITQPNMISQEKKAMRRDSKTKERELGRIRPMASENKENEQFERTSVRSTEVDALKMLHKTWARTDNICSLTQRLWSKDTANRTDLFLSDDAFIKDVNMTETVPLPGEYEKSRRRRRFIRIMPVHTVKRKGGSPG